MARGSTFFRLDLLIVALFDLCVRRWRRGRHGGRLQREAWSLDDERWRYEGHGGPWWEGGCKLGGLQVCLLLEKETVL